MSGMMQFFHSVYIIIMHLLCTEWKLTQRCQHPYIYKYMSIPLIPLSPDAHSLAHMHTNTLLPYLFYSHSDTPFTLTVTCQTLWHKEMTNLIGKINGTVAGRWITPPIIWYILVHEVILESKVVLVGCAMLSAVTKLTVVVMGTWSHWQSCLIAYQFLWVLCWATLLGYCVKWSNTNIASARACEIN